MISVFIDSSKTSSIAESLGNEKRGMIFTPCKEIISRLLAEKHVPLRPGPFLYQENTHDFGQIIVELLVTAKSTEEMLFEEKTTRPFIHIPDDFARLGKELNIRTSCSHFQYAVRDHFLTLPEHGIVAINPYPEYLERAKERVESLALYRQSASFSVSSHPTFQGGIGTVANDAEKAQADYKIRNKRRDVPALAIYLEGGDHFVASDARGRRHLFIGRQHIELNHQIFRLAGLFQDPEKRLLDNKIKTLSERHIREGLKDLYAMGNITLNKQSGLINQRSLCQLVSTWPLTNHVRLHDYLASINFPLIPTITHDDIQRGTPIIAKYLIQRSNLLDLLAQAFGVSPDCIHPLPSVSYHLDCFCKPGPRGSFFLQDFNFTKNLLMVLFENAGSLDLTENDLILLNRMTLSARKLEMELTPLIQEAKEIIEAAGFTVIPTPGIFIDQPPYDEISDNNLYIPHVNFINAVSGFSEKIDSFYYIAYGTSIGDRLGPLLMESFSSFLKTYIPSIEVYFIGSNPEDPEDFSEADNWWSYVTAQAGPDCMTLSVQTKSHIVV